MADPVRMGHRTATGVTMARSCEAAHATTFEAHLMSNLTGVTTVGEALEVPEMV